MAHQFPRQPNPNANDNILDIPTFTPIPAENPKSPLLEPPRVQSAPAQPAAADPRPADNAVPPVKEDDASTEPAPEEKNKPKRGRPATGAKASQPAKQARKAKDRAVEKESTSIHFLPETIQKLRIMRVLTKKHIAEIIEEVCDDMLNRTYQCNDPKCNCKFIIRAAYDEAPKPVRCPVCGSEDIRLDKFKY